MFTPTYLYVKVHNVTGLKYFGKTTKDPLKYEGSGKYWKRHLKTHGTDVSTTWYELFTSQEDLVEFALFFSDVFDIVESNEWANLILENGLDGGQNLGLKQPRVNPFTDAHCKALSIALSGKKLSEEHKLNIKKNSGTRGISPKNKDINMSAEQKFLISSKLKNKPWSTKRREAQNMKHNNLVGGV